MNKLILYFSIIVFAYACSGETSDKDKLAEKKSPAYMKERIKEMDDSLAQLYRNLMDGKIDNIPSSAIVETSNRYLSFYETYPNDPYAATCLDKIHQLYLQEKVYDRSILFGDSLLNNFPKYEGRANVLMSLGSTYDLIYNDSTKVRKYYTMLLEENPKLDKDLREEIIFRLKHLHLNFNQLVELQMQEIAKK